MYVNNFSTVLAEQQSMCLHQLLFVAFNFKGLAMHEVGYMQTLSCITRCLSVRQSH